MKNSDNLSIHSIRKKILLMSKVIGTILVISYILSTKLPFPSDISLFIWIIFMVLLIFAVDFLMSFFISKPIAELEQAAKRMADLDFSSTCDIMTNDEFGRLSRSLNVMAENLQNAFIKLEAANKQLEKDVEQERILLAERKDLVDSLSHEMKTPLGVIRAYAEGYQDEDDEMKKQKYAEIIISETERMNNLITTLLDLSALETGAVQLTPERLDFVELLETVAGRLLIDTPDANFELQYELPDYKVYVYTDKIRMEQVLNNLIINAKRNVRPKGILKLCLSDENGLLYFSVYNQGDTIPNEKLKKIWTKFYRDNRSKYSGSGLGLAIVAQILSMQELSYGAKNLADGVQFYFSIPTVK
ncbi:MAG: HAMP domain-containing histidine kinase [Lachnospiraceae bacterium]|nr:HAMP domain-containing histidine kinase [Lachnospiraceae bacterium]MDE6232689.1 HAMP domain-containing histidine kinase [Lachnospiraceae bacterium]MDE6253648.1 HAMP domain-containing histidine kinase [Lachnospiraceae bacterium]